MEEITGKKFGDKENPLLVSVRSGARASNPGMMDIILNLGLNEEIINALDEISNNPRWTWDFYRRFIQTNFHLLTSDLFLILFISFPIENLLYYFFYKGQIIHLSMKNYYLYWFAY